MTWDSRTGDPVAHWSPLSAPGGSPAKLHCSSDARIVCSHAQKIVVWDTKLKREVCRWKSELGHAIAISPDGKVIATNAQASPHGLVLLDAETGERIAGLGDEGKPYHSIRSLHFSPDGDSLVVLFSTTFSTRGPMHVWDLKKKTRVARLWGHVEPPSYIAFSADGTRLASVGDKTIRVWDTQNWQEKHCLRRPTQIPRGLAFTENSNRLWSISGGSLVLWDLETGEPLRHVQPTAPVVPGRENEYRFGHQFIVSHDGKFGLGQHQYGEDFTRHLSWAGVLPIHPMANYW